MTMKPSIIPAVCCIALLSACAANKTNLSNTENNPAGGNAKWSVQPIAAKTSNEKPTSLYQIGRYYDGQHRLDLALAAYQKALALDANYVEARNGMGVAYSRQGRYLEAIEAFKTAIGQAPNAAHIHNNLGYAYYLQGEYAASVVELEQATQLDPINKHALNNLALAYAKIGNQEKSREIFSRAVTVNTNGNQSAPVATESPNATLLTTNAEADNHANSTKSIDINTLSLPKDRGLIRHAPEVKLAESVAYTAIQPRGSTTQVAPNVYEWQPSSVAQAAATLPLMPAVDATRSLPTALPQAKVEVSNGNGITGMAGKVGRFLQDSGYQAVRLTNQKPFGVHKTHIQYRQGYLNAAELLRASLPTAFPVLMQRNDLRPDVSVRLVLGKDIAANVAMFDGRVSTVNVALND